MIDSEETYYLLRGNGTIVCRPGVSRDATGLHRLWSECQSCGGGGCAICGSRGEEPVRRLDGLVRRALRMAGWTADNAGEESGLYDDLRGRLPTLDAHEQQDVPVLADRERVRAILISLTGTGGAAEPSGSVE